MDRFLCAKLALQYFANKTHVVEFEEYAGNRFEFRTYEIEVAIFGEDFHAPPAIHSMRVRLSDEQYLHLLQWQIMNPKCGSSHVDIDTDAISDIECAVDDNFFPDGNVGTYVIDLTEVKRDAAIILASLENGSTI
jgi:hypothetical protein